MARSRLRSARRFQLFLLGCAALFVSFVVLDLGVFRLSDRWIASAAGQWSRRIDAAASHLEAGRSQAAADELAWLDDVFPARHAKHALNRERERLLRLLAEAQEDSGHPKRARRTWKRLVAFDPRNFLNHLGQARALVHMGRAEDAFAPLARAAAIAPDHFGVAQLLIRIQDETGRWRHVIETWRRYLDALRYERFELRAGEDRSASWVLVDGREQTIEFSLVLKSKFKALRLHWPRGTIRIESCELFGAQKVSVPGCLNLELKVVAVKGRSSERAGLLHPMGKGGGLLVLRASSMPPGLCRVRLRLRAFKEHDAATWKRVKRALRNRLRFSSIEAMATRMAFPGEQR